MVQQNVGAEHVGKFSRLTYFYSPEGKGNSFQVRGAASLRALRAHEVG
jgi:hypothetical protein